jgi:hypothetical protein
MHLSALVFSRLIGVNVGVGVGVGMGAGAGAGALSSRFFAHVSRLSGSQHRSKLLCVGFKPKPRCSCEQVQLDPKQHACADPMLTPQCL